MTEKRKGLVMETSPQGQITVITPQGEFQQIPWTDSEVPQVGSEVEYCLPAAGKRLYAWKIITAIAAGIILFILLLPAGSGLLITGPREVVAYIGIDINPSLELGLNNKGRVLEALGLNEEGSGLLQRMNIIGVPVREAVAMIAKEAVKEKYIASGEDGIILITAAAGGGQALPEAIGGIEQKVAEVLKEENVSAQVAMLEITAEMREAARAIGISPGKYIILMEALEEGMEITADNLKKSSIAQAVREAGGVPGRLVARARQDRGRFKEMQERFEEQQQVWRERAKEGGPGTVKQTDEQRRETGGEPAEKRTEGKDYRPSEMKGRAGQNGSGGQRGKR